MNSFAAFTVPALKLRHYFQGHFDATFSHTYSHQNQLESCGTLIV